MKYTVFFNVIANQLERVAPDLEAPEEFERLAQELSKTARAQDLDMALVEPFRGLAGPKYEKMLWSIYQDARDGLKERIGILDEARATLENELQERQRIARLNEEAAARQVMADREQLSAAVQQIEALKNRIAELEKAK